MALGAIRSVYTVANNMGLLEAFYAGALELPLAFRDGDNWCQFKAGQVPFALSSPSEAAQGARGSVVVFDQPIWLRSRSGSSGSAGDCCRAATWAHTAASQRSPTPRTICFRCMSVTAASCG
jgi:hypothetical protein